MRTRWALVLLLVLAAALVAWWSMTKGEAEIDAAEASGRSAGERRSALIGRKMAARTAGEIALDPVTASGRVTDAAEGSPVAGAVVVLHRKGLEGGQPPEPGASSQPLVARTDAEGKWRIENVRPGRFTLSASAEGYLPAVDRDVRLRSDVDEGELHLVLAAGGHLLTGEVGDIGGGPIEGAIVSVVRLDEGNLLDFTRAPAAAMTDEDGRYRMHLPTGIYTATVHHPDYKSTEETIDISAKRRLDFSLVPGSVIEGVVRVRGTDAPVEGAIVQWQSAKAAGNVSLTGVGHGRATTDARGRFHLRGLGSGVFHLHAMADGYATRQPLEVALGLADHDDDVVVYVDPAYKISGFVVSRRDPERGLEGIWLAALSMQPTALVVGKGPSEVDGYFEILGVQPGNYMIGAVGEQAVPNITGTSAQVVDADVTDVLVEMDEGAHVSGRVRPPMSATISVSLEKEPSSISDIMASVTNAMVRARSDEEHGRFVLRPVSPGRLRLVAEGDDGSKGELVVDVGDDGATDVVIELEPRPSVVGRVLDARGSPVTDVHVEARPKDPGSPTSFSFSPTGVGMFGAVAPTREDGSFVIKGVDPGRHDVNVVVPVNQRLAWASPDDDDDPTHPLEIDVPEQGVHDLVLRIETRNGVIEGTVTADEGPVVDAWVRAVRREPRKRPRSDAKASASTRSGEPEKPGEPDQADEQGDDQRDAVFAEIGSTKPVLTDEYGRFTISGLRAGEYTVIAEGERGSSRGRVEGVQPDARVNIRLEPLAGVQGVVRSKGSAVERYTIDVQGQSKRSITVHDPQGAYRITRLDPGEYALDVDAEQGVARAELEVRAGEVARLDLTLQALGRLRGKVVDQATGEGIAGLAIAVESDRGRASTFNAMSVLFGRGPRTDRQGRFEVDRVPPGSGKLLFVDRDASGEGGMVANAEFEVQPGSERDLGTITGIRASDIPADARGELGLTTAVASWTDRPNAAEPSQEDDRPPADPDRDRLWIGSVTPGGAADEADLRPGDEIIAIDGRDVSGAGPEIAKRLLSPAHVRAGKDLALEIARAGSRQRVTVRARPKED